MYRLKVDRTVKGQAQMKKILLSVVAAIALSSAPAFAADMPVKAKAPLAAPSPWDIAFGTAFTTNYDLRGVSQSHRKPAVQGYFELDYTATDWLKLYAGVWGSSLWTGFADMETDFTAGARLTFGNFGLDIGNIYYYYPGGINPTAGLANGSFDEAYIKPSYKFNDWLTVGGTFETGFNNFNDKALAPGVVWVGNAGHYYYSGNAVITLPQFMPYGIVVSVNPEIGYEHYSNGVTANLGAVSDTFWDVGLDFVYKAVTLDLRYWDTNKNNTNAGQCGNAALDPNTNFCGSTFVATLKFDATLSGMK
jgi:uncharacterized protein (TIGR02001 family)